MKKIQTAERVSDSDFSDNYVYQRSLLAYEKAAKLVSGKVLEIGTGSGYGVELIAENTDQFVTIDKFIYTPKSNTTSSTHNNVEYIQMTVPPLIDIPDNSFDFVISFQVIEHIKNDKKFVEEIFRVLKNNGKFIVTTPNKKMSLTRNPWHVREYSLVELNNLLLLCFQSVEKLGVFGNQKIMAYYNENKESVRRLTRYDIFNLQYRLPRTILQIPYDILNRMNRRKLLKSNTSLFSKISVADFYLEEASDVCLDFFYVATKSNS